MRLPLVPWARQRPPHGSLAGVITIVRGAVPLALFGAKGYGAVLGVIATPVLMVNAASPTVFAWIVDRWGWGTARVSLLASCSAAWVAMDLMSPWTSFSADCIPGRWWARCVVHWAKVKNNVALRSVGHTPAAML
jgi:hypothetical protein